MFTAPLSSVWLWTRRPPRNATGRASLRGADLIPESSAGPVPHAAGAIRLASPLTPEAVRRAVAQPPPLIATSTTSPCGWCLRRGESSRCKGATRDASGTTTRRLANCSSASTRSCRHGAEESSDGRVDPSARSSGAHPRHGRKQHRLRLHVRRAVLRTGLADRDDIEHMVNVARTLNPRRPRARARRPTLGSAAR
jgi:hypothetical protein